MISVSNGQLQIGGGTGVDGQTLLTFIEEIELGGATLLEHGDIVFNGPSDGVIGGLYAGGVSIAGCLAGFRITPSGSNSIIQALVGGVVTGTAIPTQAGHLCVYDAALSDRGVSNAAGISFGAASEWSVARGIGGRMRCSDRIRTSRY
jgi:hypothetical protein